MAFSFSETLYPGYVQRWELDVDPLIDERSTFQHIQIFDTPTHGRVLALDSIVQLTERDECAYSEMLAHVPFYAHGQVERVLIIGGGDGAIAEEVLKHPSVAHVDLVEIDARVVELSRRYLHRVSGPAFADPRLQVRIEDAVDFLERGEEPPYDVVIADRPDPVGPAEVLFAERFYDLVAGALNPDGVAVFQTGAPFFQPDELSAAMRQMRPALPMHGAYLTVVPTYVGGYMTLTWGSAEFDLENTPADLEARIAEQPVATDHYCAEVHRAAFALPPWISRLMQE